MLKEIIKSEEDVHTFLRAKGFETNWRKSKSANGIDIIALKNGNSFLIEHKVLDCRDTGAYRFTGEVQGDILWCSTERGANLFIVTEGTSLTKTARLLDLIIESGDG